MSTPTIINDINNLFLAFAFGCLIAGAFGKRWALDLARAVSVVVIIICATAILVRLFIP
jgi:hypothetical protein